MKKRTVAIILAGGTGVRMKTVTPKQFLRIAGKPVVLHTIEQFDRNKLISDIVIVCAKDYLAELKEILKKNRKKKIYRILEGGPARQGSSYIGLKGCPPGTQYVLIHDAVRPFVDERVIGDTLSAAIEVGASDTVIKTADTIISQKGDFIDNIPDRKYLRRGQTPQGFKYSLILKAHEMAQKKGITNATDDCGLVMAMGKPVKLVDGSEFNIKLTHQTDLYLAERLFQISSKGAGIDDYRSLRNKVAVVAGGTGGIGREIITLLEKYGCKSISLSLDSKIKCDITSEKRVIGSLKKVLTKHKKIDILVNSAGILEISKIEKMSAANWDKVMDVNLKGAFLLSKHVIPIMKRKKEGHIVHITSSSYTRGRANYSAYSASKAGLVNFCQGLSEELLPYNIYVNVVSPQRVDTPMREKSFGKEVSVTLLSPLEVAEEVVKCCVIRETGLVIDVRTQK